MSDFTVVNHGSIVLLHVHTEAGQAWVEDCLPEDRQTFGEAVVVEPRYVAAIVAGIQGDGLTVA